MRRDRILECMYEVIKDSLEWGVECKNYSSYSYFIDGVVAMTDAMLEKIKEKEDRFRQEVTKKYDVTFAESLTTPTDFDCSTADYIITNKG